MRNDSEPIGEVLKRILPEIEKRVKPDERKAGTKRAVGDFLAGQKVRHKPPPAK